jgi:hypothetical protein
MYICIYILVNVYIGIDGDDNVSSVSISATVAGKSEDNFKGTYICTCIYICTYIYICIVTNVYLH